MRFDRSSVFATRVALPAADLVLGLTGLVVADLLPDPYLSRHGGPAVPDLEWGILAVCGAIMAVQGVLFVVLLARKGSVSPWARCLFSSVAFVVSLPLVLLTGIMHPPNHATWHLLWTVANAGVTFVVGLALLVHAVIARPAQSAGARFCTSLSLQPAKLWRSLNSRYAAWRERADLSPDA